MREECSSLGELAGHCQPAIHIVGDELATMAQQRNGRVRVRSSAVLHHGWHLDGEMSLPGQVSGSTCQL